MASLQEVLLAESALLLPYLLPRDLQNLSLTCRKYHLTLNVPSSWFKYFRSKQLSIEAKEGEEGDDSPSSEDGEGKDWKYLCLQAFLARERSVSVSDKYTTKDDADFPRVGEVFEVRDSYENWAVARVFAKFDQDRFLIHFEGWGESWYFYLHRQRDADRIRPLTHDCPGLGSAVSAQTPLLSFLSLFLPSFFFLIPFSFLFLL